MNKPESRHEAELSALLRSQQGLVEAHLALVKMRQATRPATGDGIGAESLEAPHPMVDGAKQSVAVVEESRAEGSVGSMRGGGASATVEFGSGSDVVPDATIGSYIRELLAECRKNTTIVLALVVVSIGSLYAVFVAPEGGGREKRLRDDMLAMETRFKSELKVERDTLLRTESDLQGTQAALKSAQAVILETEKALTDALEANHVNGAVAVRSMTDVVKSQSAAEVPRATEEDRRKLAIDNLRKVSSDLVQNRIVLAKNLREYYSTYRALAEARMSNSKAGVPVARFGEAVDAGAFDNGGETWEVFVPVEIRQLMGGDSRLEPDVGVVDVDRYLDAPMESVNAALKEITSRLVAVMKEITETQAAIISTQNELTFELSRRGSGGEHIESGLIDATLSAGGRSTQKSRS